MIQERLAAIQKSLKVPKSQYNAFGKYNYRNCEDILEAVKPLLETAILMITDDIVLIGDRHYVKATVTLRDASGETAIVTAFAREEADKKGMDSAQITGACSSYARKYALNGLFLIDDTKDADTMDNADKKKSREQPPPAEPIAMTTLIATPEQIKQIQIMMRKKGITERDVILTTLSTFGKRKLTSSKELTSVEASNWIQANQEA